jgi:hypothetical protein
MHRTILFAARVSGAADVLARLIGHYCLTAFKREMDWSRLGDGSLDFRELALLVAVMGLDLSARFDRVGAVGGGRCQAGFGDL